MPTASAANAPPATEVPPSDTDTPTEPVDSNTHRLDFARP